MQNNSDPIPTFNTLTVPQRIHAIKTLEYPLRTQVTGQIAKITAEILATTTYRGWSVFSLSGRGRGLTCMNPNTTPAKSMQGCQTNLSLFARKLQQMDNKHCCIRQTQYRRKNGPDLRGNRGYSWWFHERNRCCQFYLSKSNLGDNWQALSGATGCNHRIRSIVWSWNVKSLPGGLLLLRSTVQ